METGRSPRLRPPTVVLGWTKRPQEDSPSPAQGCHFSRPKPCSRPGSSECAGHRPPGAAPQPWCRCPSSLQTLLVPELSMLVLHGSHPSRACSRCSLPTAQPAPPWCLLSPTWGRGALSCAGLLTPQSDIPSFIFLHCVTDTAVCPVCAHVCSHLCSQRTSTGVSPCPPSCLRWGLSVWMDAQLPGRSAPTGSPAPPPVTPGSPGL